MKHGVTEQRHRSMHRAARSFCRDTPDAHLSEYSLACGGVASLRIKLLRLHACASTSLSGMRTKRHGRETDARAATPRPPICSSAHPVQLPRRLGQVGSCTQSARCLPVQLLQHLHYFFGLFGPKATIFAPTFFFSWGVKSLEQKRGRPLKPL